MMTKTNPNCRSWNSMLPDPAYPADVARHANAVSAPYDRWELRFPAHVKPGRCELFCDLSEALVALRYWSMDCGQTVILWDTDLDRAI